MAEKKVSVKLIKSPIGYNPKIRGTVRALGLRKMQQVRKHKLTPQVKGMINSVNFLLEVTEE
ncbi:MAG: 50S ribosomal protein L30 [Spirochaetes bacterium]|nr:50S ribosomal protein L30 [Spirochaetota bacterium]